VSQFRASGVNPKTGRPVNILYGHDVVPGFRPGYFFQVYLWKSDPDWSEESENCIVNHGMLDGISEEELDKLKKEWSCEDDRPSNRIFWN